MKYELDVLGNAASSLREALAKTREVEAGNLAALKFAVVHAMHVLELTLKLYVQSVQPELIYKKIFEMAKCRSNGADLLGTIKNMQAESFDFASLRKSHGKSRQKTISPAEAIAILRGEILPRCSESYCDDEFESEYQWAKDLRDDVMHHSFSIDVREARLRIGKVLRLSTELADIFKLFDVNRILNFDDARFLDDITDEAGRELSIARQEASDRKAAAIGNFSLKDRLYFEWETVFCPECGHELMTPDDHSSTGWSCTLCGCNWSDEIPQECSRCGHRVPGELLTTIEHGESDFENLCESCWGD